MTLARLMQGLDRATNQELEPMQPAISLALAALLFVKLSRQARLAIGVLAVAGHIYRAIRLAEHVARNGVHRGKKEDA